MPRHTGTRYSCVHGGVEAFLPSDLENLELWTRFNQGITVTGAGVSQWDDQSGNGNHLLQGTDASRPSKEADGSVLCDGVNEFLAATFTLAQPTTIIALGKQLAWTSNDRWLDGELLNSGTFQQTTATPQFRLHAGAGLATVSLTLDTYAVVSAVINGASSSLQLNSDSPVTGNAGSNDMGGLVLGADGNYGSAGNVQFKEVCVYSGALSNAEIIKMIGYMNGVGGL